MPIDIKILSHIALIDLEGREGLQGGNFLKLTNFLKEFVEIHTECDLKLARILIKLIQNTIKINQISSHPSDEKLNQLVMQFKEEISSLPLEHSFYLPGGWINTDFESHGMIFEFKKMDENQIRFIIYNGGAGLELHDEVADFETEKKMPVKIYDLSFKQTQALDFQLLLKKLIEPQITHAPWRVDKYFTYNAPLLYDEIHFIMNLLKGTIVDSRAVFDITLANAGITSGTCSQATIQQFLKVYLNDISKYQKFMIDYKIYTIEDYLQYNISPRPQILKLIHKALINIQRIVDIQGLYTEEEAEVIHERLELMKNLLLTETSDTKQLGIIILPPTPQLLTIPEKIVQSSVPRLKISIEMEDKKLDFIEKIHQFDISIHQESEKISLDVTTRHDYASKKLSEFWEIPFITLSQYQGQSSSPFEGYSKSQLHRIIISLSNIMDEMSSTYLYNNSDDSVTEMIAVKWSILTLLDHAYKKLNIDYKIWGPLSGHIQAFYKYKSLLFSYDPKINSRLQTIIEIYPPKKLNVSEQEKMADERPEIRPLIGEIHKIKDLNQEKYEWRTTQYICNFEMMSEAQAIISQNEIIQELFESIYHQEYPVPPPENVFIEKYSLFALYALMNIILPKIKELPLSTLQNYQDKQNIHELKSDIQAKFEIIEGVFLSKEIEGLRSEFLDYLVILEHFDIDLELSISELPNLSLDAPMREKIKEISYGTPTHFSKLKWVRENLNHPEIQKNKPIFALFVLLYIRLKSQEYQWKISKKSLIEHLNQYLQKSHILFSNLVFLKEHHLLELVEKLYLQHQFDSNISAALLHIPFPKVQTLHPGLIFDEKQILTMNFQTLEINLKVRFLNYSSRLFKINLLTNWSDVFGRSHSSKYFNIENSNQIECSTQTRFIKALKYMHKTDEWGLILLLEFFSQDKNLILLLNEKDYQDYFLIRLFNSTLINLTIQNHSTKLIESISQFTQRVYQLSENQWTPKNEFILRVKCYLICYMYLMNPSQFHSEFVQLQNEIQSLDDSSNRKYCEYYILATLIIVGEDVDLVYFESINQSLIQEKWFSSNIIDSVEEKLLGIIEKKLKSLMSMADSRILIYSPRDDYSKSIEHLLPLKVMEEFNFSKDTPFVPIHSNFYKVLSSPSRLIVEMDEKGNLQSITRETDDKIWISLENISDLPQILKKNHVLVWQDRSETPQIILERDHRPFLRVTPEGLFSLEDCPGKLEYGEIDLYLGQFEDLSYVLSFQYPDGSTVSHLERYPFSFKKTDEQIIFLNHPQYHLIDKSQSPFAPEVACLVMEDDKGNRQCIVPIQKFYVRFIDPGIVKEGDYLPIVHDIHQHLSKDKDKDDVEEQDYVILKLINGNPTPKDTRDALYLCYIYMATHEYSKANTILKKIIKGNQFTGSSQEFKMLEMILKYCPVKENNSKTNEILHFRYNHIYQLSGEESACKLRIFVILGLWRQQGHSIGNFSEQNYFLTYHYYKIFKKELRSEFIISLAEKRGLFTLSSKHYYTYILHDKVQAEIFHLERLKKSFDDYKYQQSIDERIKKIQRVYDIESTFTSKRIVLTLLDFDNKDSIKLPSAQKIPIDASRIRLSFNLRHEELKNNFLIYIQYFMNEPLERDIHFLKYFLIQRQDYHCKDQRYPLIMLLYLLFIKKGELSYASLQNTTKTFNDLWKHFISLGNITIEVPDLKIEREYKPPYKTNQEIQTEVEALIPLSIPTQNKLSPSNIFEKPIPDEEARRIIESSFPDQSGKDIAQIRFANRQRFETMGHAFLETLERDNEFTKYSQMKTAIETQIDVHWSNALNLANDLSSKTKRKLFRTGNFESLSKSDLLNCYIRQDLNEYMQICLISETEAKQLHQFVHDAMHLELEKQWISHYLLLLGHENIDSVAILEHICKNPSENFPPPLMHLQFNLGILLRPNQLKVIEHLMQPSAERYELMSLPMGSGKTKILLPCLANYFANGKQLSLIEVPHSLLETTYLDFKISCLEHFDKKVYLFTFERWKNINKENLKIIHEHFESVILEKGIIMTSPESIQSLILQYIELLILNPETYEEEISYLGQIIHIFQTRTYAIMDEAHHVLSPHTVHNFSLGQKIQIPQHHIQWMIRFYQFIHTKKLKDAQSIISELIDNQNNPLRSELSPELIHYLLPYFNQEKAANDWINIKATAKEKEILAFYKLQLVGGNPESPPLFDKVKHLQLYVDYGPSIIESSALKRNIAIPYESHNTPLEHSEFSFHWMTMHCTIQMLYDLGINETIFKEFLEEAFKDLEIQRKLKLIFQKIDTNFELISLDNQTQIKNILEQIKTNPRLYQKLFNLILEKSILTKIEIDTRSISQNSFQHLGCMNRVLAVTGTIGEPLYYSPKLIINDELSRGNQEYLISLLEKKGTILHRCDEKNIIELLCKLSDEGQIKANFSAIIDINAHFTGISNKQVARLIGEFLQLQGHPKTHVLYFNQNNQLCAMSVEKPDSIIIIGPTSLQEIQAALPNIQPDNYFVYYDQSHAFGIDIVLPSHAFALVLTDEKHDFSQGCTRLRGLEKNQSLTLIVPTHTKAENLQQLANHIQAYEKEMLQQSIIPLTMKKLDNVIYQKILRRIVNSPKEFKKIETFFIQTKSLSSLFENDLSQEEVETYTFLQKYRSALLKQYRSIFGEVGIDEVEEMQQIISNPEIFPQKYRLSSEPSINARTSHLGLQLQKAQQISHAHLIEQSYTQQASIALAPLSLQLTDEARSLNAWFGTTLFSPNLSASHALMLTYEGQKFSNLLALKPVFLVQFRKTSTHQIDAKMICIEEYEPSNDSALWYTTQSGFVINGNPHSEWLSSPQIKIFNEQIHFYNGDFGWFEKNIHQLIWLMSQTEEKIKYFKSTFMKLRETPEYLVDDVHNAIIKIHKDLDLSDIMTFKNIRLHDQFLKKLKSVIYEFYLSPNLNQFEKMNDLLSFVILKSIDQRPQSQRLIGVFFSARSITDQMIIETIESTQLWEEQKIQSIKDYINGRSAEFKKILNENIKRLALDNKQGSQIKTFEEFYEQISPKPSGRALR